MARATALCTYATSQDLKYQEQDNPTEMPEETVAIGAVATVVHLEERDTILSTLVWTAIEGQVIGVDAMAT